MAADLRLDWDLMTESSKALGDIYTVFDTLRSRRSQTMNDWGSDDIKGALKSFADDWDNHREKTMKSVDSVKQDIDEALEKFGDADAQLKKSLAPKTVHGSGAQPR